MSRELTMKCPHCPDAVLSMTDRQGVEVDYCPQCRGVWLDRGELDKLLERAASASTPSRPARPDFVDSDFRGTSAHAPRRRKSWLDEIFD
jgi:Zn-finger nucleic acid-binding protein